MAGQKKGGLGRGLAALIPTGPEEGPRLGNAAADVIIG
ncbi:chromosome partitioning protein, partial [Tsukamurella tyrosinosolvens]